MLVGDPANREINREFCRFRRSAAVLASSRRANSMTCIEIPYVTEQGIFGGLTGNFFQRTGNSHARTGNSRLARRQANQRDDEMRAVGAPLLSLSGGGWFGPRQHDHASADLHALIEILDIVVDEPHAARRYELSDRRRLIGAVDTVERPAEIEGARTERIARPSRHEARQIRLALDHLLRRSPIRPRRHPRDAFGSRPGEAFAADADAVAHSLAVAEDEIEIGARRVDDDRSCRLLGPIVDKLASELRRQFLRLTRFRLVLRRQ